LIFPGKATIVISSESIGKLKRKGGGSCFSTSAEVPGLFHPERGGPISFFFNEGSERGDKRLLREAKSFFIGVKKRNWEEDSF